MKEKIKIISDGETAEKYGIKAYAIPVRYVIDDYNALLNKLHPSCNEAMQF